MNTEFPKSIKLAIRYGTWSELANLLRILNELLVMLVWFITLSEKRVSWLQGFLVLGAIYFGSYLLSRLLQALKWKISIERTLFALWILVSLFLAGKFLLLANIHMSLEQLLPRIFTSEISSEATFAFWVLLFSVVTILHGVHATHRPISTHIMVNSVRWIIVFFAIYAVIFAQFHIEVFLPSFFAFLLSSLIGLSLTRVADLSEDHGGRLPGFNWQWAAGIGGISLLVIILSLVSSLVINLNVAKLIAKGVVLLAQLITGAIVVVLAPVLYVIIAIIQFIIKLLQPNFQKIIEPQEILAGEQLLEDLQSEAAEAARIDPRLFIMIGIILFLAVIAIIQLKRRSWQRQLVVEDDISRIEQVGKKKNPLQNLIPASLRRRKRASAKSLFAAARIRYIYSQLMDLCDKLGKPRARCVTPLEFLPLMDSLFPLHHADLETITHAYNRIRYGELPETDTEVEEILEAWKRVNAYGSEKLEGPAKKLHRRK